LNSKTVIDIRVIPELHAQSVLTFFGKNIKKSNTLQTETIFKRIFNQRYFPPISAVTEFCYSNTCSVESAIQAITRSVNRLFV